MVESDLPGDAGQAELAAAEAVCLSCGATSVVRAADAQEADWLRNARRMAYWALDRLGRARMEDVGVPRARVPELVAAIEGVGERQEVVEGVDAHVPGAVAAHRRRGAVDDVGPRVFERHNGVVRMELLHCR